MAKDRSDMFMRRYCVMYVIDRKERCSPWFRDARRAEKARELLSKRYGAAIVLID